MNGNEDSPPFTLDSLGWVASLTKLATTICALQLVDRGLVELDEDLGKHVQFLDKPDILEGVDDQGRPILNKATTPVTLRYVAPGSRSYSPVDLIETLQTAVNSYLWLPLRLIQSATFEMV